MRIPETTFLSGCCFTWIVIDCRFVSILDDDVNVLMCLCVYVCFCVMYDDVTIEQATSVVRNPSERPQSIHTHTKIVIYCHLVCTSVFVSD